MDFSTEPRTALWPQLKDDLQQRQTQFDQEVQQCLDNYTRQGGRIFCHKGCHNCCTLTVNASLSEALRVAEALPKPQPKLADYIQQLRQMLPEAVDLKHYLKLQRSRLGSCPFLDDAGACTVYHVRPFACRALLSTRPADWCGVDFSTLSALDKQLFLSSLDPTVVDFPTQYLATPRETGQQLEGAAVAAMQAAFGLGILGNLPYLVWLERSYRLSALLAKSPAAVRALLEEEDLAHPFLIILDS